MALAGEIVKEFHDAAAAEAAKSEFLRVFREREIPTEIQEIFVDEGKEGDQIGLARLVCLTGLASSSSEARRLLKGGAVRVDGIKQSLESATVTLSDGMLLQVGKRRFCKVRVGR
jgi:tyrosyl-tRNA synthetase